MPMPVLQVALDLLSIEDAITISEEAVEGGAGWLEVGTPLLKNHGMTAVKRIKEKFPDCTVVADMKTMDAGDLEVEMAAKNGADVVCILGLASDFTIKRAVNSAKAHDVRIMADLIGVANKTRRAKELEDLGADYILIHTSLDVQKVKMEKVDASLKEVKKLKKILKVPIAAAGGINKETIGFLRDAGIDIFVVGRALIKAEHVTETARNLGKAIGLKPGGTKVEEPTQNEMIRTFEKLPTPIISDAMKRFGAMRGLYPINEGIRIAGPAFTVKTLGGDWGKVVKAVDVAKEGDILVVDAQSVEIAVWGELATLSAMNRGIKGVIIDGASRDADDIKRLKFPLWTKCTTPNAGEPHGHGELNVQITCAGITVKPGDIIIADEVGVVVVPKERAAEILKKSEEVALKEKRYKKEIKKGKTLSEIFGL